MVCHYSYFFCWLKFQDYVCNVCHDLTMLYPSLRDTAIIIVKGISYCCVIHDISKSKAVLLLKNLILSQRNQLFMSDLWLSMIDLNSARHSKKI